MPGHANDPTLDTDGFWGHHRIRTRRLLAWRQEPNARVQELERRFVDRRSTPASTMYNPFSHCSFDVLQFSQWFLRHGHPGGCMSEQLTLFLGWFSSNHSSGVVTTLGCTVRPVVCCMTGHARCPTATSRRKLHFGGSVVTSLRLRVVLREGSLLSCRAHARP